VLLGIAVFSWPALESSRSLRWRELLDALLFTTSLFLVFWLAGLGSLFAEAPLPFYQKASQLVFFLDYALLMGLALYRGLNALGWILATFFAVSIGNLTWVSLSLRGHYYPGHLMEPSALLISVLYLLTALAPGPSVQGGESRASRLGSLFLPYLPFLLALPMAVSRLPRQTRAPDSVTLWLGLGMIGLLLLRQLIALWDSHTISRSLETQVRQRTLALEESQAMLLRTQRMNILATLGAGLAHDLNNLLSVVVMTTDLLEEETDAGQPPARKDLDALRRASTQASELVKKLMAFGRRGESQAQLFDLRERVQGMAKVLEKLATPSVQVQWELGPDPLLLRLDPVQIEQILVNLVANARDAMPKGGTLRIRTARCESPKGVQATLSITDSGTGIAEENLGHLFDAFFTTKEPGKGTGLGLASVKAIADECGATITVESQLGMGTTFRLGFRLASAD
jgi:signal transduction histidine kinase